MKPWVLPIALGVAWAAASTARAELPAQWESGGYHHEGFEVGTDAHESFQGKPSIRIQSTAAIAPDGEANAATGFFAQRYRGKRVRYAAYLRTTDVAHWCGLWLSIAAVKSKTDDKANRLRFDNMRDRPVKGTTGWTRYQIVVDVPEASSDVTIGVFLVGSGAVWMSQPSFEIVADDVSVTSSTGKNLPLEPQLNLEHQ